MQVINKNDINMANHSIYNSNINHGSTNLEKIHNFEESLLSIKKVKNGIYHDNFNANKFVSQKDQKKLL